MKKVTGASVTKNVSPFLFYQNSVDCATCPGCSHHILRNDIYMIPVRREVKDAQIFVKMR